MAEDGFLNYGRQDKIIEENKIMANMAEFIIDGVSYTYDKESRDPLALKNVKKALDGELIYDKDSRGITEVVEADDEIVEEEEDENGNGVEG